jgi:hypothetical protein
MRKAKIKIIKRSAIAAKIETPKQETRAQNFWLAESLVNIETAKQAEVSKFFIKL